MLRTFSSRAARAAYSSASRALSTTPGAKDVVIVSSARTAIGSLGGALASVTAPRLGATAIEAALKRAGVSGDVVDEVFMGNVVSAGVGQAPARQATLFAGIPQSVPCTTVNKVCASGMKSIMLAAQSLALGMNGVMVAGGMESMSNVPYYLPGARFGHKYGHGKMLDGLLTDGLWDVYNDQHMGNCGELCAASHGFSREDQDSFAIESYKRAQAAAAAGVFAREITPVVVKGRRGDVTVDVDEEPGAVKMDKIPTLRTAFKKDGTVTAANASSLNDGAAALVLMTAERAAELGATPLARIRGFGDAARDPVEFTVAPADAVPIAVKRAGLEMSDVEYHEINEAFSVVVLANMKLMGLQHDRVNVHGGAVSLGHPIGMSGARVVSSLLTALQEKDATFGAASICNGGGGASAIVIERLA